MNSAGNLSQKKKKIGRQSYWQISTGPLGETNKKHVGFFASIFYIKNAQDREGWPCAQMSVTLKLICLGQKTNSTIYIRLREPCIEWLLEPDRSITIMGSAQLSSIHPYLDPSNCCSSTHTSMRSTSFARGGVGGWAFFAAILADFNDLICLGITLAAWRMMHDWFVQEPFFFFNLFALGSKLIDGLIDTKRQG